MKAYIVTIALTLLGILMFRLLVVGDTSIMHSLGLLWTAQITNQQSVYP